MIKVLEYYNAKVEIAPGNKYTFEIEVTMSGVTNDNITDKIRQAMIDPLYHKQGGHSAADYSIARVNWSGNIFLITMAL